MWHYWSPGQVSLQDSTLLLQRLCWCAKGLTVCIPCTRCPVGWLYGSLHLLQLGGGLPVVPHGMV
jgi:hypothetical protein